MMSELCHKSYRSRMWKWLPDTVIIQPQIEAKSTHSPAPDLHQEISGALYPRWCSRLFLTLQSLWYSLKEFKYKTSREKVGVYCRKEDNTFLRVKKKWQWQGGPLQRTHSESDSRKTSKRPLLSSVSYAVFIRFLQSLDLKTYLGEGFLF